MKLFVHVCAVVSIITVAFISVGGFFADLHWRLAWYSNPRPHFFFGACIALIWFLIQRNKWLGALSATVMLINLIAIMPLFIAPTSTSTADNSRAFTLLHINTNRGQAELAPLNDTEADIIFLQEVTPSLDERLSGLFPTYNIVQSHPLDDTHGSATLVKQESGIEAISSQLVKLPEGSRRPLIQSDLTVHQQTVQMLNFHAARPHHAAVDDWQKVELGGMAEWSRQAQAADNTEIVVMGDFNVTPWSSRFSKLLADANLYNSQRGFGLQNSWPSTIPLIFGLPIDHALHSSGIATTNRRTFRVGGTDHAALLVDFVFLD